MSTGIPKGRRTNGNNFCFVPSPLQGSCHSCHDNGGTMLVAHSRLCSAASSRFPSKYSYPELMYRIKRFNFERLLIVRQ